MIVTTEALERARILIVDDERANVRLLERLLISGGFADIRGTTDPRAAAALFDECQPDIVMLDLHMPHVDGFKLMEHFRSRLGPADFLPILVLTADVTQEARDRALSGGAKDFLTKPLERTEVLLRTRNLLETRFLHIALKDENRSLEAKLAYQAFHDSLTGLANRALFRDRVQHAVSRAGRGRERFAVVYVDLDNFKSVNDRLGHDAGDRALEIVADRLLKVTRGCDTVARLGGDEFGLLLEGLQAEEDALAVVNRIVESMRVPLSIHGQTASVTASIGVAYPGDEDGIDSLLRNADAAMYHAKGKGPGLYAVFEPSM